MEIVKKIAKSLLTAACATGLIVFLVWIIVIISSCNGEENTETSKYPFVRVANGTEGLAGWEILIDKETRVMYFYNRQGITVMLEADGSPQLWTGELPE